MKNIVALYGVPRSGTSWLGQILDSCPDVAYRYQPLFSYRFKNRITTEDTKEEMERFFQELYEEKEDAFLNQADKRESGMYPDFEKKSLRPSVLAYKEVRYLYTIPLLLEKFSRERLKIVGIVRNPCDVLESWINAPSEYKPEWDIFKEWNFAERKNEYRPENYYGYYKWKEYIKMTADMQIKYPDAFFRVRYEDLVKDAEESAEKIFSFLEIPFDAQTKNFILESQSRTEENAYSVYREKRKDRLRKVYLPEEIREKIIKDLKEFDAAAELGYQ